MHKTQCTQCAVRVHSRIYPILHLEQLANLALVDICSDYADSSGNLGASVSYIRFSRHIVKVNPLTVFTCYNALCSKYKAIFVLIFYCSQYFSYLFLSKLFGRLNAYAVKDFICMVVAFMVVIVTAAAVVVMVVVMVVFMVMVVVIVTAAAVVTMVVVMMVVVVMVVFMIMVVVIVVMMFVLLLFLKMMKCFLYGIPSFHCGQNLFAVESIPVGSYDYGMFVMLTKELHNLFQLFLIHACSMA